MLGILLSKLFFSLNFIYSQISNSRKSFIFSKSIDDEEITKGWFEDLMGENVAPRREFIESRATNVNNLYI